MGNFRIVHAGQHVRAGEYKCGNCGKEITINSSGEKIARCTDCKSGTWIDLASLDYKSPLPQDMPKP